MIKTSEHAFVSS